MKHATVIFLLLIFIFNLGGSFIVLKIQQHRVRQEIKTQIKQGISSDELTSIVITPHSVRELSWKDNEEFSYKGTMYDVVHIELIDARTKIYHCISDSLETKLIAKFKAERKSHKNNNKRSNSGKVFKFLKKMNLIPDEGVPFDSKTYKQSHFAYLNNYASLSLETLSPPPEQVL